MAAIRLHSPDQVTGLVPAAGRARRIAPLPCSKELYPIGQRRLADGSLRPKVVAHYLLEGFSLTGIRKAFFIVREGKWDIPGYFGDGSLAGLELGYLVTQSTAGVPYTLSQAFPFLAGGFAAIGFPDIIYSPRNAFAEMMAKQTATGADLVLGVFPAERPHKTEMLELDDRGRIIGMEMQPLETSLLHTWALELWAPSYVEFTRAFLENERRQPTAARRELRVAHIVQAALANDLQVETVIFEGGFYTDIGTPDELLEATRRFSCEPSAEPDGA